MGSATAMASAAVSTLKVFAIFVALATASNAVPVEDGNGVSRLAKMQSFSSSMSDVNGESEGESHLSDEAYVNGIPVYLINDEHNFNPVEGEHESFDVVEPQENQRIHLDNLNGRETIEYQEPLESDIEDLDYYENDDEDYPLDSLSIDNWLDNEVDEDDDEDYADDSPNYVMN